MGLIIRYISFNVIEKSIIPKSIFTETRTQDSLRVCDLSSCDLLAEADNCVICTVLLSSYLTSDLLCPLWRRGESLSPYQDLNPCLY
jgi:hypothetical protein